MLTKRSLFLFLFLISSFLSTNLKAQKYFSTSAGYSAGKFSNSKYTYYGEINNEIKSGYFVSISFDSLVFHKNLRFGLQFGTQNAKSEVIQATINGPIVDNYEVQFQYCQFDVNYIFRFIESKKIDFNFILGSTFSYNLRTQLNGNGSSPKYNSLTDSLGQTTYHWYTTSTWERNNEISTGFSGFNFGLNFGLSLCLPLNNKIDFVLENRYSTFFHQITNMELELGSFFRGDLSVGLRFRI